jgi:hypothetical protein
VRREGWKKGEKGEKRGEVRRDEWKNGRRERSPERNEEKRIGERRGLFV